MIVGVLTTCHTQYTSDSSICIFLFNRTTLQVFVTYLTGALYVHPLWFYKHQHDNRVRSACQRWWFQWRFWLVPSVPGYTHTHTHTVSCKCAYHLRMELSDGGCFPNLVRNCRWTIVSRQSFWITLYLHLLILDISFKNKPWLHSARRWGGKSTEQLKNVKVIFTISDTQKKPTNTHKHVRLSYIIL